ncbi:hypothetical protein AAG906_003678 [Vitis piasezkii]
MQYEERSSPVCHASLDKSSYFTRVSAKMRRDRRSQLSDAMRKTRASNAWYGGKTTYSNCPRGISRSLGFPSHDRLAPPSANTTTSGDLTNRGLLGFVSKRLDDMLSTPFSPYIINYEPPRGFMVPKFSTYDGINDPSDHIMHYRQLMTLDIGNDALLCKVFPASLHIQALSWFHRLPMNFVNNFQDFSEAFVGQYLCLTRHKQNINTLQNIKMQENESLREFVKRFGQVVLQVESCSMDVVLQIFKRSICSGTPLFESLVKKPPATMDNLFKRANKYSKLEDNVCAAAQLILVTNRNARNDSTGALSP